MPPPPSCAHCMTLVPDVKYRCQHCGSLLCATHRGKHKSMFHSSTYYCLPPCPETSTTTASSDRNNSAATRSPPPPPPPNRPPSSSALRGKTTILQTSFGVIQETDATPPRSGEPVATHPWGKWQDGGDMMEPSSSPSSSSVAAPSSTTSRDVYAQPMVREVIATPVLEPTVEHVYNHRGELQAVVASPVAVSSVPSSMSRSRLRSTTALLEEVLPPLLPSAFAVSTPQEPSPTYLLDDTVVPQRPPPSLNKTSSTTGAQYNSAPRVRSVGVPLVTPEPINPATGKRDVLIGPDMLIHVTPEEKTRFAEVELPGTNQAVRGTVLGTDGGYLVWHERGKRYAQRLTPSDYKSFTVVTPARCKHCGSIMPRDEADEHVALHKRASTCETGGTAVGDEQLGTACGDTALLRRLVRIKQLGSGAQGEVWLCRDGDIPNDVIRATMKQTNKATGLYVQKDIRCSAEKEAIAKYQQSVRFMALNSVHIIAYLAVQRQAKEPTTVTVLMPYYHEGDLAALIRGQRSTFSEHYISSLLLQMATALQFLHSRSPSIVHGDIKPENVLMFNHREQIVLMDLDASKELTGHTRQTSVQIGTSAWMAPEAMHQQQCTTKSDVWSMGLLAYVLALLPDFPMLHCEATKCNELLNSTSWTMEELLRKVGSKIMQAGYSREFAVLTTRMLHRDPKKRPAASEIMEMITEVMTAQLVLGNGGASTVVESNSM